MERGLNRVASKILFLSTVVVSTILFSGIGCAAEVNVSSCYYMSTANNIYNLNRSINSTGTYCFTFAANNITFNGNGFLISNSSSSFTGSIFLISSNINNSVIKNVLAEYALPGGRGVYSLGPTNGLTVLNSTFNLTSSHISLSNVKNLQVLNSTFGNFSTIGFNLLGNITNVTIEGNTFKNQNFTGLNVNNLYFNGNATNVVISNNLFKTENNTNLQNVRFVNGTNVSIFNNIFNSTIKAGREIFINGQLTNSFIYNNTFVGQNDEFIEFDSYPDNIQVYNNTFDCKGLGHGALFGESTNSKAFSNTITNCSYGFLFHNGSTNNMFYDSVITVIQSHGLYTLDTAMNNTAYNITLNGLGGGTYSNGLYFSRHTDYFTTYPTNNLYYNIYINNTYRGIASDFVNSTSLDESNNTIKDFVILNSSDADVYLITNSTGFYLVNGSYNISKEIVSNRSSLYRKWHYQLYVNYSNGTAAQNVNVTFYNVSGNYVVNLTTGSDGYTPVYDIIDYFNNGTRIYHAPYNITSQLAGFAVQSKAYNATADQSKYSDFFTFDVSTPAVSETPASNTDETASPGWGAAKFTLSSEQANNGIDRTLYKNWEVKFKINNEEHKIKVSTVKKDSATIIISSSPINLTLFIGEEKKLNLNDDSYLDLYVRLNSIKLSGANFTIKTINEFVNPAEEQTISPPKENLPSNENTERSFFEKKEVWIELAILVILLIAFLIRMGNKKRRNHWKTN